MAARGRRSSGTARLLVLLGILTVLGVTFAAGVYAGRIWSARAAVVAARAPEPARRGSGRGLRLPEAPAPQLTFYQELTAPLTAPPPPPKPAKTSPPPLVTIPRPGEQADVLETEVGRTGATRFSSRPPAPQAGLAAPVTTHPVSGPGRFTVQVASYRVRPPAEVLRESLAAAGHDARVVEAEANGPVYRVQIGEFATRDAARALAARLAGERSSVAPFVTTR